MIYGIRQTIIRVVNLSFPLRHPQQTRHYLSTASVPHIQSSPSRTASRSRKHGEQVISASYDRVVSLWDMHERLFDGNGKERYQTASPTATPFVTRDIPHLWRKSGINILIHGGKHTILVSSL